MGWQSFQALGSIERGLEAEDNGFGDEGKWFRG